jgi:hypothetical protein
MCTLIYATVPSAADLARLPSTGVRLGPTEDPFVVPKLRPGEVLCWPGGIPDCGAGGFCGTVLGACAPAGGRTREEEEAAATKRLRKKGWGEHKIQAWLAQKSEVRVFSVMQRHEAVGELALWTGFVRAALEDARLAYVGLMVFTAGSEHKLPTGSESVQREACDLTLLEQGVLYRIRR